MSSYSRYREKVQSLPTKAGKLVLGRLKTFNNSGTTVVSDVEVSTFPSAISGSIQRCWDQVNTRSPLRVSGRRISMSYTDGGPFLSVKVALPHFNVVGKRTYNSFVGAATKRQYIGGFSLAHITGDLFSESQYEAAGRTPGGVCIPEFDSLGPQAYALLRPRLEKMGLAVSIAELRDLPGMLKTSAKGFRDLWNSMFRDQLPRNFELKHLKRANKDLADHFLNHKFGWVPFVSDVKDLLNIYQTSHSIIGRISSQNGEWVRRKRVIEEVESDELVNKGWTPAIQPWGSSYDVFAQNFIIGGQTSRHYWEHRELVTTRSWAEGLFRYYRPEFDVSNAKYHSAVGAIQRQLTVYGARITPSNLYKATPWTWLADWFSNLGDHVDLLNDMLVDGVVSKYMYLMHHRTRKHVVRHTTNFWDGASTFEFQRVIETKQRHRAGSPYGFTLASSYSARQIAILAALGISRV